MVIFNTIKRVFSSSNLLYYPGCITRSRLKKEYNNYKEILNALGIHFITLKDENNICCGLPALNAGYENDFLDLAKKNLEIFKKHSVGKIITNCPECFKSFREDYKLLPEWKMEVEHISTFLLRELKRKFKLIKNPVKGEEKVTYHDPCYLARHSKVYDEPRQILKLLGYNVIEMRNNRMFTLCCGAGGGLKTNNPELANSISKRIIKQAKAVGATKIISTCPLCFSHLDENSKEDIEIEEFSHILAKAFGIIKETKEEKPVKIKENDPK